MIGYARIPTDERSLALQLDALREPGCREAFQAAGAEFSRAGLDRALAALEPGGVLAVCQLDRLGRSTLETVKFALDLDQRGVGFPLLPSQPPAAQHPATERGFRVETLREPVCSANCCDMAAGQGPRLPLTRR